MTRIRSRNSSRIQDRRGQGGGGFGGLRMPGMGGRGGGMGLPMRSGGGILGLLVAGLVLFLTMRGGGGGNPLTETGGDVGGEPCESDLEQTICGANEDVQNYWEDEFPATFGGEYDDTQLVIFSGSTTTGCGAASAQVGPFYCPQDRLVYFDLDFLVQLQQNFGAAGDLASQYIVAHEFGHHVQNLTGQNAQPGDFSGTSNEWSVEVELQADCYAGVWAYDAARRTDESGLPLFEEGEIREAINAARAVGDDAIQQRTQGRVNPSEFTHGTSEQRAAAFETGYRTGDPAQCDDLAA